MTEKKSPIIVAVFGDMAQAKRAYDDLQGSGFGDDHLGLADPKAKNNGKWKHLERAGVPETDSRYYQHEFGEGHPFVTVRVGGLQLDSIQKAIDVLKRHGAYDANSSRNSQNEFGSNVKKDARTSFFDIAPGILESEEQ